MSDPDLIYLDHNATTPLDPEVLEAMRPSLTRDFGNASSRQHALGARAAAAVEEARARVAAVLGADPREIVFTSGATEANNLALKGLARAPHNAGRRTLITVASEHRSVLDPCAALEREGYEVVRLPVDASGLVDLELLRAQLSPRVLVVSVMHANNEIGVLQPVAEIGRACKQLGVLFHTDATQSFGKEELDVEDAHVDLLSLSAHKIHGPKGVGALFVRRRGPRVRLQSELEGGGHERGLRSGTLNVPGIVGLGAAAAKCARVRAEEQARIRALRDRLEHELGARVAGVTRNGAPLARLANTANLAFERVDAESLLRRLPELCASSSAACTSAVHATSHVLAALGCPRHVITSSVRFSLGRFTTAQEIEAAVELVGAAVTRERAEGPLSACDIGAGGPLRRPDG